MTLAQQTAAATEFAQLWRALMPTLESPGADQFMLWAGNYTETQVCRGINGAARKLKAMQTVSRPMTFDDVARYASSIMRNESMGRRNFQ